MGDHDGLECATRDKTLDGWCKSCLAVVLEQAARAAIIAFGLPDTWETRGQVAVFLDEWRQRGWWPTLNMDRPLVPTK